MKLMLKGWFCLTLLLSAFAAVRVQACDDGSCTNVSNSSSCERDCSANCCDNVSADNTGNHVISCGDKSCNGNVFGKTHFSIRPQDSNTARLMMGVEDKIHLFGKDEFYGVASVAFEYGQTFNRTGTTNNNQLGRFFSFVPGQATMTYGPDCTGVNNIYGFNFGTTSTGKICLNPRIKNFVADIDLYLGLDEFICGLYARLDIPIVNTRWCPGFQDQTLTRGADSFEAGVLTTDDSETAALSDISASWDGSKTFGVAPSLKKGKLTKSERSTTAVAALHFDIGYDWLRCEDGHFATSLHVVAPTGTRPTGEFLFEPIAGPNHSWQIGGTVDAAYRLWENCDGNNSLTGYFYTVITTLFRDRQCRIFGIKDHGAGSSWLLLKRFDGAGNAVGLERAANVFTQEAKIGADVMADGSLMLQYDRNCYSFGLGYNFWVRSEEKLVKDNCACGLKSRTYGIKGSTPLSDAAGVNNDTQSNSTIGTCADTDADTVFLTDADVDYCTALNPVAWSNKVFAYASYNWRSCCDWQPYVLVGGEAEFGHGNTAVNQWGIIFKGGVQF